VQSDTDAAVAGVGTTEVEVDDVVLPVVVREVGVTTDLLVVDVVDRKM